MPGGFGAFCLDFGWEMSSLLLDKVWSCPLVVHIIYSFIWYHLACQSIRMICILGGNFSGLSFTPSKLFLLISVGHLRNLCCFGNNDSLWVRIADRYNLSLSGLLCLWVPSLPSSFSAFGIHVTTFSVIFISGSDH